MPAHDGSRTPVGSTASAPSHVRRTNAVTDLRAWVRATTVRTAIDLLRRGRREVPADQTEVEEAFPPHDPELDGLRALYGEQFKRAFGEAFAALPKRDRSILRYRFVDGLDIDGLGAVYRVHRSTRAGFSRFAIDCTTIPSNDSQLCCRSR
jgi:RNA polymerase sigma-70 factor, ECF subfamily